MRFQCSMRALAAILVILALHVEAVPTFAISLPPGFVSEAVVSNLSSPTTIAFSPDGRMFIGQKDGRVRVFQNGTLLVSDFVNLSAEVNNYWDRGLLGLAIHPNFPAQPYVYLLYTYDPPGTTDNGSGARVSRLVGLTADAATNYNTAVANSAVVLLGTNSQLANIGNSLSNDGPASCENINGFTSYVPDCLPADSPSHTIGTLAFGLDGALFVSNGDGAHFNYTDVRALRALSVDSLAGKVLRIDPLTGQGYPDNPFYDGNPNSNRSKVYSYGLRNPFRVTVDGTTGEPYIGDVGWNAWEEINAGRGKNFGWPCYEGSNTGSAQQSGYATNSATAARCSQLYQEGISAVTQPVYAYSHSGIGASVQAGTFYRGTAYPTQYRGALFYEDYNRDWIKYVTIDANGFGTSFDFALDVSPNGGPVQLLSGPDTNLYYVVYDAGVNTSEVRRIRYQSSTNSPPVAKATATPTSGLPPLAVAFSSNGSSDPDGDSLTYLWNFGDGSTSTLANPSRTYAAEGVFTAMLTVTDSKNASSSDQVVITVGNRRPTATILSPPTGTKYNIGDVITFQGQGTDPEQGQLSGASLVWEALLHHNEHVHFNFFNGTGTTGSFVVTDHGDNTWLELCLTATDNGGLSDRKCVTLLPNTTTLTFKTKPDGLQLVYDGILRTTPFTVTAPVGASREISAPPSQGGKTFRSWSDGGAATHFITVGSQSATFTANYFKNR